MHMFKNMSTDTRQNSAANWAYLPEHLLEDVLDRFVEVSDYVRFSVVCKRWLYTAKFHHKQWHLKSSLSPQKQTPMLLVDHNIGSVKNLSLCSVVVGKDQLLINKVINLHVPNYIYKDTIIRCCGSSHGWLIFIREDMFALILYNPFTKSTINLPPIFDVSKEDSPNFTTFILAWFKKVFLSEDPSLYPDTYQVLVVFDIECIWLFRSGSDSWVRVKNLQISQKPDDMFLFRSHAIYYHGKFYIAGLRSMIIVETNNDECCAIYRYLGFQQLMKATWKLDQQYLVESCDGRLLYIERYDYEVEMFNVYEVNLYHEDGPMCSLVPTLGAETLFLGSNYSFSLLGSCQPDCIYYTDYFLRNAGIYNVIRRKHNKCHYPSSNLAEPSIWIVPQAWLQTS